MNASWIFACFAVALAVGALLFVLPALTAGNAGDRAAPGSRMRMLAVGLCALGIPLVALAAYLSVGRPDALEPDRNRAAFLAEHAQRMTASPANPGVQDAGRVAGQVIVAPGLEAHIAPDATLFVFARSPDGPPQPVAVFRAPAGAWPMRFILDADARVMTGQSIADFERVTLTARLSRSGQALPQRGDLEGKLEAVPVGSNDVRIVIDRVR